MKSSLLCFYGIVSKEMYLFYKEFIGRFIDLTMVLSTWIIVFGYLMGHSGLDSSYGSFILVGAIASFGLFETIWRATILAQDISDRKITNFLVLPIDSKYVFVAIAASWAISTSVLSIMLVPIGKLVLWNKFDLSHMSFVKFILIFLSGNMFYGFFALWIGSLVTCLRNTSWLWARLINPIFMFCGYFYTWKSAYEMSHFIGYLHFINPLLYVLEGSKAAVLGQEGYLPFWWCLLIVILTSFFFAFDGIRRIKKRIDFV